MTADQPIDAELLAERNAYLREMTADLQEVENLILDLPAVEGAAERKRQIARQIHTIKGVAGSYGMDLLSLAAHRIEDLLASADSPPCKSDPWIDRLLDQKDQLAAIAKAYLQSDEAFLLEVRSRFEQARLPRGATAAPRPFERVLIVEPSLATLRLCTRVLQQLGSAHVISVKDGYEALGQLLKEKFDGVIASLQAPTIDGQSLAAILRLTPGPNANVPVILLTSSAALLDPAKTRPDYVLEKDLGLSNGLKSVLARLTNTGLEPPPVGSEMTGRALKKILLVDDSRDIHSLVRIAFKRYPDIQIVALADPTGAVETARKEAPDLILLDVQMTPISGKEVMRALKASPAVTAIPVAFFTGTDDAEEARELAALGAWQIFKKPFAPKIFSEQVVSLFQER
jgi:CheY-like chemotaxis protein/HPt (histidine-containing phosphotransfer) domain-containing protein